MASTASPGVSDRGASGVPSTSGSFASTQARLDGDARRSPSADRSPRGRGTPSGGKKPAEAAADTLDKLLNELVNASAQRVNRSGVGGRSERRAGPRERWSSTLGLGTRNRESRSRQRDWLREIIGSTSAKDLDGVEDDSSDEEDERYGAYGGFSTLNAGVGTNKGAFSFGFGAGHNAYESRSRDTFDDATDAIYRASLHSLTRSGRGGVYRDTGLGVGDASFFNGPSLVPGGYVNAAAADGGVLAADAATSNKNKNATFFDASNYDGNAFPSQKRGSGFFGREFAGAGGAVGVSLREHVEAEARDTSSEAFAKYARDMYRRVHRLIQSTDVAKRLAGVYAVDQLTEAKIGETANKMNRFATYLRDVFTVTCEPVLAEAAARAVGKIARVGGALTAGIADREVKRCVEWLKADADAFSSSSSSRGGGGEARRYAAVLVLRELAEHAPEVFNVHISSFIDAVWPALRDSRLFVRQAAVRALRACLVVIERRETRYRVQWYYRLYEETQNGLKSPGERSESGSGAGLSGSTASPGKASGEKNAASSHASGASGVSTVTSPGSIESQHGSLLAFGELLRHTGEFMLSRYKEVAETVLGLHESREKIVRRAVLELVPKLAAFSPKRFTESYLERSMRLLLSCLKNQAERDAGFTAIGDVAAALAAADETDAGAAERAANGEHARAASAGAYGSPGGSPRRATRAGRPSHGEFQSEFVDRSGAGGLRFKGAARLPATEPDEYGSGSSGSGRDRGAFAGERLVSASPASPNAEHRRGGTHRRAGSLSGFGGFAGSLARITSQSSVHAMGMGPAGGSSDNLRRLDHRKPLARYLPEIAAATRETCAAMEKAFAAAATAPPTKSGLRPAPAREPGAAEAFLCVGALAKSVGAPWEPHARALMPYLFAGGLTAPLVAALASLAEALPQTAPSVSRRLVDAISEALRGSAETARAGAFDGAVESRTRIKVERAELVGARFAGDDDGARGDRVASGRLGTRDANRAAGIAAGIGSTPSFSKLRRVFSSGFFGDGEMMTETSLSLSEDRSATTDQTSGASGSTPRRSRLGALASGGLASRKPETNVSTNATVSSLATPGSPTRAYVGSQKRTKTNKNAEIKAEERDAAALKFHRARVRLALRTLGTFPFFGAAGSISSLGYARKRVVEFLDDDDAATRREAALACCRLLDSRDGNTGGASGDGSEKRLSAVYGTGTHARGRAVGGGYPKSGSGGWSASVEEFIVSRLLAVAVSDLDAGVRKAVLASFCKPSVVTDGHLGQAESLRALFVALNDENPEVRLIAIRLVGRLAPRNPAYALPALRRHLLQLIAELEHSAESHLREESARLIATLTRAVPRLIAPYIAPVLRALVAKLRVSDAGAAKKKIKKSGAKLGDDPAAARDAVGLGARGDGDGGDVNDARGGDVNDARLGDAAAAAAGPGADGQSAGAGAGALAAADGASAPRAREGVLAGVPGVVGGALGSASSSSVGAGGSSKVPLAKTGVPAKERAAVLGAMGEIAQVGGEGMRVYADEILPLVIDGVRFGATRATAVVTLGQYAEATGSAGPAPFAEHPHLLRLLLRVLAEESGETRAQTLRTLGVLGALDPLAHKDNEERLHGQGLLSMEGVRGVGREKTERDADASRMSAAKTDRADAGVFADGADVFRDAERRRESRAVGGGAADEPDDGDGGDDDDDGADRDGSGGANDPIPVRHLTTASDAFYPSVALNALLRVLRDPSASSRHHAVTRSVMYIFRALGMAECVPYLPATVPTILRVIRECEDGSREFMYAQLAVLVGVVKGHIRRYLEDIFDVIRRFWGRAGPLLRQSLRLLEALAAALHDDFRAVLPEILPRVVGVLADAERSGEYEAVPATLRALESFGSAADEHLHLALPALVRLFRPNVAASVPTPIRARTLRSLAALLPRAQLSGHASAVAHPLLRVLDGDVDELRAPALAALAAMAHALRDDFALFVPMTRRVMEKRNLRDPVFERVADTLERRVGFTSNAAAADAEPFALQPPLATVTSGSALPSPPGQTALTSGFANLALRASREAEAMYELNKSGGAGTRSRTPGVEYAAGDSVYRGGSGRGEGSHYGGRSRSPELDPNAFSPLQPSLSPLDATGPFSFGRGTFTVDEFALRRAFDSSSRSTKEDWLEWMRHLSVEMLRQSPSPALRACLELASTRPRTARDLFCASFASCWSGLSQNGRDALVRALESAFGAPTIPPEIVGVLLNLAEFCEHDERPLPVEARTLGAIAERCRAYAKALHYKETEFVTSPAACVEAIIAINNRLQLPEAAMGVLVYAQAHLRLEIKEGWYEKLGQWENALDAHRRKAAQAEAAMREHAAALESSTERELASSGAAAGRGERGGSFGRRRGGIGIDSALLSPAERERERASREHSVARKRSASRAKEIAAEARREATLGQMRCLAALAEWEALGRLCAREWDAGEKTTAIDGSGTGETNVEHFRSHSPAPDENSAAKFGDGETNVSVSPADAALRARMAPLATQAAWHLGDWRRMETYCAAIPSPADTSNTVRTDTNGVPTIGRNGLYVSSLRARDAEIAGDPYAGSSVDASGSLGSLGLDDDSFSPTGSVAGGVAADVEFFRAVLATRRGDQEEARARIRAAREHLGKELAALVTESYDRSYGGMVRVQQLTELEEVLEYAELGRVLDAARDGGAEDGSLAAPPLAGRFGQTANVGDSRSALKRRSLIRAMWRERIYGVQRKVEVWQALLAVRSLALPMREETETWLKFASLNRKAGRARQAHRTLLRLLDYDPSRCAPGSPGYGAGSGQPNVMLAYVKHQWALGNRRDAFARLQSLVGELRYARDVSFVVSRHTGPLFFFFFFSFFETRFSRGRRGSFPFLPRARVMSPPKD